MSWDSIISQQRVKNLLRRMVEQQRLPHALLFFGPDGTGKDAMAIELARVLNCASGLPDACGVCASCQSMDTLRHPHLRLVFALPSKDDEAGALDKLTADELEEVNAQIDEKAANHYHHFSVPKASGIKISSIRDIRKEAAFRAEGRGRTVVLITEAERMNPSAANALLKTLEEPGGDLLLILTTARKEALLPTIVSRCQSIRFDPLRMEDVRNALISRAGIAPDVAENAARLANGSYAAALDLAASGNTLGRDVLLEYIRAVVLMHPVKLHTCIQTVIGKDDRLAAIRFLVSVASWFRDVIAVIEHAGDRMINTDLKDPIERFAAHYPDVRCSDAIAEIERVIEMIRKNVHLVNMMIVLSQRLRKCIVNPLPGP
ncbi:MAG: DNA polymerase III subunit [Bacteroidia bacterium]|nr:DNA polymerase III subunit [Bacteroidia bacterium]